MYLLETPRCYLLPWSLSIASRITIYEYLSFGISKENGGSISFFGQMAPSPLAIPASLVSFFLSVRAGRSLKREDFNLLKN